MTKLRKVGNVDNLEKMSRHFCLFGKGLMVGRCGVGHNVDYYSFLRPSRGLCRSFVGGRSLSSCVVS